MINAAIDKGAYTKRALGFEPDDVIPEKVMSSLGVGRYFTLILTPTFGAELSIVCTSALLHDSAMTNVDTPSNPPPMVPPK